MSPYGFYKRVLRNFGVGCGENGAGFWAFGKLGANITGVVALVLVGGVVLSGAILGGEEVFATASSLTVSISGNPTINLPPSAEGKFADSGDETISVSTTHAAGYVLKVKASSATDLKNSSGTTGFTSISSAISAETFDTSDYNGKWGYKPSKLNGVANTNYLPAPTTGGSTIDSVSSATNNDYTVSIGARADINTAIDSYANTFVFTVTANPTPYKITYNANTTDTVSNMPSDVSASSATEAVTISSNSPTRSGWYFTGWNTSASGDGTSYVKGSSFALNQTTTSNILTLYAQWSCTPGYICYRSNAGTDTVEGTMADQIVGTSATSATLQGYNYKRSGYAFLGWSTQEDPTIDTTNIYGPMQTIAFDALITEGLNLYAVWLPKSTEYTMQTFSDSVCSSKLTVPATYNATMGTFGVSEKTFIALEDTRDSNVYVVGKLTDGKCWMLENLRLGNSVTISSANTHSPISSFTSLSTSSNSWCTENSTSCVNQKKLNTNNMNMNGPYTSNWYGYGNYYNWYSATAGNGTYSKSSGSVTGDLCPKNWKLPIGGQVTEKGSFYGLANLIGATSSNATSSNKMRQFPNNFVYSGYWEEFDSAKQRGTVGVYWSSTTYNNTNEYVYELLFNATSIYPGTYYNSKYYGLSVRCVTGS